MAKTDRKPGDVPPVFVAGLAIGLTRAEAAKAAGISERTGYRWLEDPAVVEAVRKIRQDMTGEAFGELVAQLKKAVRKLVSLMDSPDPRVQLVAARSVLTHCLEMGSVVDREGRIAAMEKELRKHMGVDL